MATAPSLPSNLPVQLTSFVGRETEIAELADLLRRDRLVTIAGAPGLGKTRLATEVAVLLLAEHPDGARFVGLAALVDPAQVVWEVSAALGVREQLASPPLEVLAAHVGARRLLLVLDNCEHLLDGCAQVAEALLVACPGLHVLTTSHEPLRVPGERVWRIGPLAVPGHGGGPEAFAELAESEAVRLFQARAALVRPQFTLSPANGSVVASICRRLDGIPLAIELAAARTEMMSADDILERLEDRFRLLTGGSRTAMPRHQTLRAALDWGHQLLNAEERKLFRRLSVFPGSFELAAAEAVCALPDLPVREVLALLTRLVDKSLVGPQATPGGHTRYRMLETVRQYAAERLGEAGEAGEAGEDGELRRRHAEHCLGLAERAMAFERRPGQAYWLERLESEHDDLRSALHWLRANDPELGVRLALALAWFWLAHGHLREGRDWLEGVLAVPALAPRERARTLFWQARMALWLGEFEVASELGERGLAGARELGEGALVGWTLSVLGSAYTYLGDDDRSRACLEEMLATAHDEAQRIDALATMGELLLLGGDLAGARRQLELSLTLDEGEGARWRLAPNRIFLAAVDYLERDYRSCRVQVAEALDVVHQIGNHYQISGCLQLAAALAQAAGDPTRALRLCAAGEALREAVRAPLAERWTQVVRSLVVEPARAALSPEAAEAAWAEGSRLDVDAAVAYALAEPGTDEPEPPAGTPSLLSRREREVAVLAARGMTNRQIARQLVIAERTVEGHLERIRGKLGVHSRTQVAVWVVERGWLSDPRPTSD